MTIAESLDENYARAGYHARQEWGNRSALLLVDFAQAYYEPGSPLFGGEGCQRALDAAKELLETARSAGIPVIFTEVRYGKGGGDSELTVDNVVYVRRERRSS